MERTDAELVEASRRGDTAAFGTIVERYQRAVAAVAYATTRDRTLAEDVAQLAFVTAWRRLGTLKDTRKLAAWLCGITRNLARALVRRRARERELGDHDVPAAGTPFDALSDRQMQSVVADALERVPPAYREVLVLFYCEEQSVKAVASALALSEDATHQRLSRGRKHLASDVERLVGPAARPPRDLAAAVVAAIAVLGTGSSAAEAAPGHAPMGTSRWIVAATAGIIAAITGGTYWVMQDEVTPTASARSASPAWPAGAGGGFAGVPVVPSLPSTPGAHGAVGSSPADATRGGMTISTACAAAARHYADRVLEARAPMSSDPLPVEWPGYVAQLEQDCETKRWSQPYLACVQAARSMSDLNQQCEKHAPPSETTAATGAVPPGSVVFDGSSAAIPPYTGPDLSCTSVAKHLVLFSTPDETQLASVRPEVRPRVERALARMRQRILDETEASCEQGEWSEAKRRCLLAATTRDARDACM